MSWFDTSGFASIAKNALKEAQRTIDKALDIKEESFGGEPQVPIDTNAETFFQDWPQTNVGEENQVITSSPAKANNKSIWGSFTGSFFETDPKLRENVIDLLEESSDSQVERVVQSMQVSKSAARISEESDSSKGVTGNLPDETFTPKDEPEIDQVAITRPPSRSLSGSQNLTEKDSMLNSNIIDIPLDIETIESNEDADESSYSDKTITSLNENTMESSSDTTDSANSVYLKNLLADAIIEKCDVIPNFMDLSQNQNVLHENTAEYDATMVKRDTSPHSSSESRSDMVKIGSDHTSGHTSGDEIETTTSSDIEIISSPNGDSSSTHSHSRHSPAKLTEFKSKNLNQDLNKKAIKGHSRELSGASSVSDDCELERTLKRLSEVTSILEQKENRLIDMTRRHSELQETNDGLRKQLDLLSTKELKSMEMSQVAQEYTQRLSALEKKFQQAIRDRDGLKTQLEQCKKESATRLSKIDLDQLIEDKNHLIDELRYEGEKLSKTQLQQSNTIKKLRQKEKEQETNVKSLRDTVEELTSETDRLKRSLTAKEDIERLQIEAIHQLTARNKKIEYEFGQLQGTHEDLQQKHETVKKSLEVAKKELVDKNRTSNELQHREKLLQTLESSKKMTESQNEEIIMHLDDLRGKLLQSENDFVIKERKLRAENAELVRRVESAESRNEELSQSVLEVSKPLVRQLEALQANHNLKVSSFEKLESEYNVKINELNSKVHNLNETEQSLRKENFALKNKLTKLENEIEHLTQINEQLKVQLDQTKTEMTILEQHFEKSTMELNEQLDKEKVSLNHLQKEYENLQHCLNVERVNHAKEMAKCKSDVSSQENLHEKLEFTANNNIMRADSPTLSIGRMSASGSLNSNILWPDDNLEVSNYSRCTNILEMEVLQSNLKQRDGDMQQMQWELNRREQERLLLNTEITKLLRRIEELEKQCKSLEESSKELGELQQQYETLCQLYGEKVEEADELRLDLVDVKEMYKTQVDHLLKQLQKS